MALRTLQLKNRACLSAYTPDVGQVVGRRVGPCYLGLLAWRRGFCRLLSSFSMISGHGAIIHNLHISEADSSDVRVIFAFYRAGHLVLMPSIAYRL